jgi:2-polyprenyl-3-methyl-5-hydroxy-6-metoxy-1,4-benzoquinol methylase
VTKKLSRQRQRSRMVKIRPRLTTNTAWRCRIHGFTCFSTRNNLERQREFFNAQAAAKRISRWLAKFASLYGGTPSRYQPEVSKRLLGVAVVKTVLNAGCGEGEHCILLAKLGAKVTGIDISVGAIELAKARVVVNGVQCNFICVPLSKRYSTESSISL